MLCMQPFVFLNIKATYIIYKLALVVASEAATTSSASYLYLRLVLLAAGTKKKQLVEC